MTLASVGDIYSRAREGGYGVAGFCAENLDIILAILAAATEARAPVVVTLWEEDIRSVGLGYLETIVRHGAGQIDIPVGIMLDHGTDLGSCLRSMVNGHTAVMIDASHRPLEQNVTLTRQVCDTAHLLGVLVEGELGTVRRTFDEAVGPFAETTELTDPALVADFVARTGVDALAVSIGTESGIPARPPRLDYARLDRIASQTTAYLAVHGGSGTRREDIRKAIDHGVTAFRFASEFRLAYLDALEAARSSFPPQYPDTRRIFEPAREAVKAAVLARIDDLGCGGKA